MRILIVDSCSENLLVIAVSCESVAMRANIGNGKKHNSTLLPMIDQALAELNINIRDVEYIVDVVGAGSFTGIRLGATTCNGLAFAIGAKRVAMNAFESLAYNNSEHILVAIDAKHGNYYGGEYLNGKEIALGNYTDADLASFDGEIILWNGEHNIANIIAVAKDKINNRLFVDGFVPLYLKKSQAERELECRQS